MNGSRAIGFCQGRSALSDEPPSVESQPRRLAASGDEYLRVAWPVPEPTGCRVALE
jgi:hypothetical protein